MSELLDTDKVVAWVLGEVAAGERRRRWRVAGWMGMGVVASAGLLLVGWEAAVGVVGAVSGVRGVGYLGVALATAAGGMGVVRWGRAGGGKRDVVGRLEHLYPQARGLLRDAWGGAAEGLGRGELAAARAGAGRAWLADRGGERLAGALAESRRAGGRRARAVAVALTAAVALAAVMEPAATRRVASAFSAPGGLWGTAAAVWRVVPGDARIAFGDSVRGTAEYAGSPTTGPLILEWQDDGGAWQAETLAAGPAGGWHWSPLQGSRIYRVRYGASSSPSYRLAVGAPFALVRAEARGPGEPWRPLAGRVVAAGMRLEIRGAANAPLARAAVDAARESALSIDGSTFAGSIVPGPGAARILLRGAGGGVASGAPFRAAAAGGAFAEILRPTEDPTVLGATSAWLEVRAGAAAGLRALIWETADGRRGRLGGALRAARDTTVAAVAPLAVGRAPGDTVRFRVVAHGLSGAAAATAWRRAVVADAATLRAGTAALREAAASGVARAVAAAREAAVAGRDGAGGSREPTLGVDRQLQAAADSLARALDRTLADPALGPRLRERLEGYAQTLRGAAEAELDPRAGLPADPAAAVAARAAVLDAVRSRLAAAETALARAAAADTLERLSGAERALAERTRATRPDALERAIAPRQAQLEAAARQTAGALGDSVAAGMHAALDRAQAELAAGDPAQAALAQEHAADVMEAAAVSARQQAEAAAGGDAGTRAAMERAGAESLFLAERQRALAGRLARPAVDNGSHRDRLARQEVVTRGLERALGTLVDGIGGRPAGVALAKRLARAVFTTQYAEDALRRAPGAAARSSERLAVEESAAALTLLAQAFLLPADEGGFSAGGASGAQAESGAAASQLSALAGAQRALADAMADAQASGDEPAGGNPEAAAAERQVGREFGALGPALDELGVEAAALAALAARVEASASRLERGLPGAVAETELRALARQFADLGRLVERTTSERRSAEAAHGFVPAAPPPLPPRTTAARLDPATRLAPWEASLPRAAIEPARAYLERLAAEGVREP